ncbi:hypothetical protein Ancab_010403, partial [Ancistrocladus abbreviatus]
PELLLTPHLTPHAAADQQQHLSRRRRRPSPSVLSPLVGGLIFTPHAAADQQQHLSRRRLSPSVLTLSQISPTPATKALTLSPQSSRRRSHFHSSRSSRPAATSLTPAT